MSKPVLSLFTPAEALATAICAALFILLLVVWHGYIARNDARARCAYEGGQWSETVSECIKP